MGLFKKIKDLFKAKPNVSSKIEDKLQESQLVEQNKFDAGLKKSSSNLNSHINEIAKKYRTLDQELIDEIEETLISYDIGTASTQKILNAIVEEIKLQNVSDPQLIKQIIIDKLIVYYIQDSNTSTGINVKKGDLNVVLVTGVNGVGKTTSIAKLANRFLKEGHKVCLIAGDTFRAGAVEQLNV
jgi:fused signal recognition particle receptor